MGRVSLLGSVGITVFWRNWAKLTKYEILAKMATVSFLCSVISG